MAISRQEEKAFRDLTRIADALEGLLELVKEAAFGGDEEAVWDEDDRVPDFVRGDCDD